MSKNIIQNRFLYKVITVATVCLFLFNTLSAAYPAKVSLNPDSTLQVQSAFNPITDITGKEYDDQVRIETAFITAMLLRGETPPRQNINAMLDIMCYQNDGAVTDKERRRILNVVSNPVSIEKGLGVEVEVEVRKDFIGGERQRFKIRSYCTDESDIQLDASKITIERVKSQGSRAKDRQIPGREAKYNNRGTITELRDPETGIVWEKYHYKDNGRLDFVELHNPKSSEKIRLILAKEKELQAQHGISHKWDQRWVIQREKGNNSFIDTGEVKTEEAIGGEKTANERQSLRGNFILKDIQTYDNNDKNNGVGKTVIRWMALAAYRERKVLRVVDAYSPVLAAIMKDIYDLDTIKINIGKKQITFKKKKELETFLLEQDYNMMLPGVSKSKYKIIVQNGKVQWKGTKEDLTADAPDGYIDQTWPRYTDK